VTTAAAAPATLAGRSTADPPRARVEEARVDRTGNQPIRSANVASGTDDPVGRGSGASCVHPTFICRPTRGRVLCLLLLCRKEQGFDGWRVEEVVRR
jgi:hypothetical protein